MTHLTLTPLHHGGYAVRDETHARLGTITHNAPNTWSYHDKERRTTIIAATLPALRDNIRRHYAAR